MTEIFLNGLALEILEGQSLAEFLKDRGFERDKVAIEVDGEVIPKSSHSSFFIKSGMKIEIIAFVGGG